MAGRRLSTDRFGGAEAEHLDPELVARVEAVQEARVAAGHDDGPLRRVDERLNGRPEALVFLEHDVNLST